MKLMKKFQVEEYDEPYRDKNCNVIRRVILYNDNHDSVEVGEVVDVEGVLYKIIGIYKKFVEIENLY